MEFKKYFLRLVFYPFGIIKQFHKLGITGSRDKLNRVRFRNSIIDDGVCIDDKSLIAPHVHILENCVINHSTINSYTYVGNSCLVQHATIGKFCSIANDVLIGLGKHPIDKLSTSPLFYRRNNPLKIELVENESINFDEYEKIEIGNDVWIGARSIILHGVNVGHGSVIAANAVVTKNVPPYAIVGGTPARVIKYRFSDEKINTLLASKWWENNLEIIKNEFLNEDLKL